jgi:hypothetical protein
LNAKDAASVIRHDYRDPLILAGKKASIVGIANERSITWGFAQGLAAWLRR